MAGETSADRSATKARAHAEKALEAQRVSGAAETASRRSAGIRNSRKPGHGAIVCARTDCAAVLQIFSEAGDGGRRFRQSAAQTFRAANRRSVLSASNRSLRSVQPAGVDCRAP